MAGIEGLLPAFFILVAVGALAGVVAGLLGVGGGIVLVPAFYYTFSSLGFGGDHLMQICVATSLSTIVFTSIRSVLSHHRKGAVVWPILRSWGPWIALGAVFGVFVVGRLHSDELMFVFGVIGVLIGLYMAFGRADWRLGNEMPHGVGAKATASSIGLISTMMGIGGGSFGVPIMTAFGQPIHRAVATSAGIGVIIAIPSVLGFLLSGWEAAGKPPLTLGYVNVLAFAVIISMTLFTAPIGVKIAHALDPKPLKRAFAIFITLTAANMLRQALGY